MLAAEDLEEKWKVLVYDQRGSDIIAPCIKVRDIRESGVTM